MCPRNLAPDDPYLRASYLCLAAVDECDALAQIEFRCFRSIDAFDLDEGGVGVGVSLAALVGDVLAPGRVTYVSIVSAIAASIWLVFVRGLDRAIHTRINRLT